MAAIWSPEVEHMADEALIARVSDMTYAGRQPGDHAQTAMLADLSRHILSDPASRHQPKYVALAYWLRPANLARLTARLDLDVGKDHVRVPRGVALHLPPANVDTIFVYSWAMSVLSGNANVVRLGARLSKDTEWLVSSVCRIVSNHGQTGRHLFCHYEYGGGTEAALSAHADLRMIWGGDDKVRAASQVAIRPDGLSIGFPDRKSITILSAGAYDACSEAERDSLARDLYNDIYWFDQMGCGSPRLLIWLGDPDTLANDLYHRLGKSILQRGYSVETGTALSKRSLANDLLAEGLVSTYRHHSNALDICRAIDARAVLARSHGGGFLCDWVADSLKDIATTIDRKTQTITCFGLSEEDKLCFARLISGRGGYRIVPVGQALQFDPTWDGVDLFEHMTRRILIR